MTEPISENNIRNNNQSGVFLGTSSYLSYNVVSGNNITNNKDGISLAVLDDCNNFVSENNIANNSEAGIQIIPLHGAPNNILYHNNFINNTSHINFTSAISSIKWDNGYPSGGNYWSDYNGTDLYTGAFQNETGIDGIGDTPYVIDANNRDRYPLMNPHTPQPDVAIKNVSPFKTVVGLGYSLNVSVTAANQRDYPETFNVTAYYANDTFTIEQWNKFWSTGDCNRDGYINEVDAKMLDDNFNRHGPNPCDLNSDGIVDIFDAILLASGFGKQIWKVFLPVIDAQTIVDLAAGNSVALMFTWNTTGIAYGNCTVTAVAKPVVNETNTFDNNCTSSIPVHVGVPGDISGPTQGVYDGTTNMRDIGYLILLFTTKPSSPNWSPNADINNDATVNMRDISIAILNFNKHE